MIARELEASDSLLDSLLTDTSLNSVSLYELNYMSNEEFATFLKTTAKLNPSPQLSLMVGKKLTPAAFGELGSAILAAPNLLESSIILVSFGVINTGYYEHRLESNLSRMKINCIELVDLAETRQFQTEVLMMVMQNFIEAVIGSPVAEGKYIFPYPKPSNAASYPKHFNCPCYFDGEHTSIELPRKYLETKSPFYNREIWKSHQLKLSEQIEGLKKEEQKPYSKHITNLFNARIDNPPSAADVAEEFNITERTLNRRLSIEGTNFREIKNSFLQQQAEYYLIQSNLTVDAIASQLGYKDFPSFRRAFKGWKGMSPQEYRTINQNKHKPG